MAQNAWSTATVAPILVQGPAGGSKKNSTNEEWPRCACRSSARHLMSFAIIQVHYDGFSVRNVPPVASRHILVYAYMLGKYTLRWGFYRTAAILCRAPNCHSACL
ncbi:hypothetical protein BT96DRAFT_1064042 [Gymnopus androsaceus JB14]|uniref:Uncharacterized protein n=1 Tax=Gymnopus androsaceus JB14 TaxID=1447944 RepID=A0A6A4I3Z3_9AGAR|nr:hypothetical protein BT96DRAFT_1064042 [Gymnopus androsaceus JB14]